MKKIKSIICKLTFIIATIMILMIFLMMSSNTNVMYEFNEPKNVYIYGNTDCWAYNDYVLVYDEDNSVIQIFGKDGVLLKGVCMPNSGGGSWFGVTKDGVVKIYIVRTETLIEFNGIDYTIMQDKRFIDKNEYISQCEITYEKGNCTINSDGMTCNADTKIYIQAPIKLLSRDICGLIWMITTLLHIITHPLFPKMLWKFNENWLEKIDRYNRSIGKLK